LDGLKAAGAHVDPALLTALAVPVLAFVVWKVVHRARKQNE
jgi:uncharacterized membrane-anchored protein